MEQNILWCMSLQAYVVEDNKQLILEGQLHVALQTIGKEASSLTPREVQWHSFIKYYFFVK